MKTLSLSIPDLDIDRPIEGPPRLSGTDRARISLKRAEVCGGVSIDPHPISPERPDRGRP